MKFLCADWLKPLGNFGTAVNNSSRFFIAVLGGVAGKRHNPVHLAWAKNMYSKKKVVLRLP